MKIEVGRCFRTRDGRRARVICTDAKGDFPVVALIETDGEESAWQLSPEGNLSRKHNYPMNHDLVSPWVDPAPRMLAWIVGIKADGSGTVIFLNEGQKPSAYFTANIRAPWLDQPSQGGAL